MTAVDDRAALKPFLGMIVGRDTDRAIEVRCFPGPRQEWLCAREVALVARRIIHLAESSEVYVGAAPRVKRAGGKDACPRAWALWADCDTVASVDRLQAFEPTPTFIVRSGGLDGDVPKRHAWWALAEPLGRDVLEPALRRLVHHLGADPRCAEIARVMRPPATVHRRDGEPRPVTVEHGSIVTYVAADVVGALADPPAPARPTRPAARPATAVELTSGDPLRGIPATTYVPVLTGQQLGRDGKATCPWHEDWNPSLHVYDDDRGWYCFQCGAGGSIIDLGARLYGLEPRGRGFHDIRRRLAADLLGGRRVA